MGDTPATAAPGTDNPPQATERRKCRACEEFKVVSPETWPYRSKGKGKPYKAIGNTCITCEAQRKKDYEARKALIEELAGDVPPDPLPSGQSAEKTKQREAVNSSKLDVARALKAGSRVLNDVAPGILARIVQWSEDPSHEEHRWAVQFLAERIVPRKLYEELGGEAAGVGALGDKRPHFTIQILPAQPEAPVGRVIEGSHTVELLPAPPKP